MYVFLLSSSEQLYSSGWIAPQRTDAVWVNISLDPTWATNFGVYDNTQLILFDPESQSLGNFNSYLNATGEPSERAFSTPFSLYYNFAHLLRYTVEYSSLRILKRSWRDVIGLPGVREIFFGHVITFDWVSRQRYQSVNLYTIGWFTQFTPPCVWRAFFDYM